MPGDWPNEIFEQVDGTVTEEQMVDVISGQIPVIEQISLIDTMLADASLAQEFHELWRELRPDAESSGPVHTLNLLRRLMVLVSNDDHPGLAALAKDRGTPMWLRNDALAHYDFILDPSSWSEQIERWRKIMPPKKSVTNEDAKPDS